MFIVFGSFGGIQKVPSCLRAVPRIPSVTSAASDACLRLPLKFLPSHHGSREKHDNRNSETRKRPKTTMRNLSGCSLYDVAHTWGKAHTHYDSRKWVIAISG